MLAPLVAERHLPTCHTAEFRLLKMVCAHPPRLYFSAMSEAEAPAAAVAEEAEAAAEPIKKQEAVELLSTGFAQAIFPTVNSLAAQLDEVRCVAFAPPQDCQCGAVWDLDFCWSQLHSPVCCIRPM
jgi:hypothetical protein